MFPFVLSSPWWLFASFWQVLSSQSTHGVVGEFVPQYRIASSHSSVCNPCHLLPYSLRKTQSFVGGENFLLVCPSLSWMPGCAAPAPRWFYSPFHFGKLQVLIRFQIYSSLSCSQSVGVVFLSINPFPLICLSLTYSSGNESLPVFFQKPSRIPFPD